MIDLRSDTVTQPTPAMREAMMNAPVGDDVYRDDPSVNRLEELAACMLGKEAALFVVSGTMGNQVAIMAQTSMGDEIICSAYSHIVHHECGAPARLSGVNMALVDHPDTSVHAADVERLYRDPDNLHYPRTSLVCLENALANGRVMSLAQSREVSEKAHALGLPTHLDGARLFNAAAALGCDAKELAAPFDSVTFCLSKGLCAPVGAVLCGDAAFIHRARRMRKLLGGGMRQAGVLAAPGIVALESMISRLVDDHATARYLAEQLNAIEGISVDLAAVEINMVFFDCAIPGFSEDGLQAFLQPRGVLPGGESSPGRYRFVTHHGVTRGDVDTVIALIKDYIAAL